jgi:hypothetical protein
MADLHRRVTRGILLGAALVVAVGCSTPERTSAPPAGSEDDGDGAATTLPPRADATLRGRVVGNDGAPRAGVPISVVRTDTGSRIDDVLAGAFTLGLSCLADPVSCGGDQVVDSAVTDADGRYELTLPDAHIAGYETDEDWVASIGLPTVEGQVAGPVSTYELEVGTAVQEAPDLTLLDLTPQVQRDHGQVSVVVPPLPALEGGPVAVQLQRDGEPLWEGRGPFEAIVLEDVPVVVVVSSRRDVTVQHPDGRTIYHQALRSATVAYQGDLVPPSRGVPCQVQGAAVLGCPLTDGALLDDVELAAGGSVTLDLHLTRDIGTVIVRGSRAGDLVVEGSADGQDWTPFEVGPLGGAPGVVARSGEQLVARYVRVRSESGAAISEISTWAVVRIPPDEDDDSSRTVPIAVAAVLVVLVGAALIRWWTRRP